MEPTQETQQARPWPGPEQIAQTVAYMENSRLMNQIIHEMKEIPELPSEKPNDVHALIKVEFPDTGGVYTFMEGYEHPYRGFPFHEFVDKIDLVKKVLRGALSSLFHSIKSRNKIKVVFLALVPWVFNDLLAGGINASHRVISRFLIKPLRYSEPMRELHRAMSITKEGESERATLIRTQVRDLICMLLENDNAYRFRFQDIIIELDKQALQKRPRKELIRLLSLIQTREVTQEVKDTWTLIKTFLPAYLIFNRSIQKALVSVLTELDLSKITLSKEDLIFCKPRKDYKFGYTL
jgi:hypothetical protein